MAAPTWTNGLIVLTLVLINCSLSLSAVLGTGRTTSPPPKPEPTECQTKACYEAANRIRTWMNESVDPCDNFYEFACGNWINNQTIPHGSDGYSVMDDLTITLDNRIIQTLESSAETNDVQTNQMIRKMRKYYQRCLKRDWHQPINVMLQQLFSHIPLPYINVTGWKDYGKRRLEKVLADLANYGLDIFVESRVQIDINTQRYVLWLNQQTFWLLRKEDLISDKRRREALKVLIEKILTKIYQDLNVTATFDAEELLQLQAHIVKWISPYSSRLGSWTVRKLKDSSRKFNWKTFLDHVTKPSGTQFSDTDTVILINPNYIKEFGNILANWSDNTIGQWATFLLTIKMIDYFPEDYREILNDFTGKNSTSRKTHCATLVNYERFRDVIAVIYSQEHFDKSAKDAAKEMTDQIKSAFLRQLEVNEWLDAETKKLIIKKIKKMMMIVGYPERTVNGSYLMKKYGEIPFTDNVISDEMKYNFITRRQTIELLRMPIDKYRLDWIPLEVNAYSVFQFNKIVFPLGILLRPYFYKDYPKYLNYGGIGIVIGHELVHGFDNTGRKYDENGNKRRWWSNSSIAGFKEATKCIRDQYSSYRVPFQNENVTLNGQISLGENIADNSGVKFSFEAYQEVVRNSGKQELKLPGLPYTPNQLFFITTGHCRCSKMKQSLWKRQSTSSHVPQYFRTIGVLSNLPSFHEAFNCKQGTKMHPAKLCSIY